MRSQIDSSKPTQGVATTESVRDNFRYARDEINEIIAGTGTLAYHGTGLGVARSGTGINQISQWDSTVTPYRRLLRLNRAAHLPSTYSPPYTLSPLEPLYIKFRILHTQMTTPMAGSVQRIAQETTLCELTQAPERQPGAFLWSVVSTNSVGFNFVDSGGTFYLDVDMRSMGGSSPTRLQVVETNGIWTLENQQEINPDSYPGGETVVVSSPRMPFDAYNQENYTPNYLQVSGLSDLSGTRYATLTDSLHLGRSFRLPDVQSRKELINYLYGFMSDPYQPRFDDVAFIRVKNMHTSEGSNLTFPGGTTIELYFGTNTAFNTTMNGVSNPFLLRSRSFVDFYPKMADGSQQWHPSGNSTGWNNGGWVASDNSSTLIMFPVDDGTQSWMHAENYTFNIVVLPGNNVLFGTGIAGTGYTPDDGRRLMVPGWFNQWSWGTGGSSFFDYATYGSTSSHGPLSYDLLVEVWLKG